MEGGEQNDFDDYFRVEQTEAGWTFEVGVVEWLSPHEPQLRWCRFRQWKRKPDAAMLSRARTAALVPPRFFRRCAKCNTLQNAGHMFDRDLCQGCASKHHGVVF